MIGSLVLAFLVSPVVAKPKVAWLPTMVMANAGKEYYGVFTKPMEKSFRESVDVALPKSPNGAKLYDCIDRTKFGWQMTAADLNEPGAIGWNLSKAKKAGAAVGADYVGEVIVIRFYNTAAKYSGDTERMHVAANLTVLEVKTGKTVISFKVIGNILTLDSYKKNGIPDYVAASRSAGESLGWTQVPEMFKQEIK